MRIARESVLHMSGCAGTVTSSQIGWWFHDVRLLHTLQVAAFQNDRVDVVSNDYGNRTTPALVVYDSSCQEFLVGEPAVAKAHKLQASAEAAAMLTPAKIAHIQLTKAKQDAEAFIGQVCACLAPALCLCRFCEVAPRAGLRRSLPVQAVACALTAVHHADLYACCLQPMRSAVIAVPPRATEEERDLLAKAASKCGIKSVTFIHSALSALLAHGLDAPGGALSADGTLTPMRQNVVVFRHGGRHVDVTVVSVVDGTFNVLSSMSDDSVGGLQFDEALVQHCNTEFRKKYRMEVSGSRALMRLRAACEEARRSLSINARVSIEVDSLFEGLDFATVITRPRFEDLCHALFRNVTKVRLFLCASTLTYWLTITVHLHSQPIESALEAASLKPADVQRVVMAGGSSRMPRVKDTVSAMFPATTVIDSKLNPEETVASGAAIAACMFSSEASHGDASATAAGAPSKRKPKAKGDSEAAATDVLGDTQPAAYLPASVGFAAADGALAVAVHRLAVLPCTGSATAFLPVFNNIVTVSVWQGDDFDTAAANRALANLPLAVKEGQAMVEVTLTVVVSKSGGMVLRAVASGEVCDVRLGHGEEAAPRAFEDVTLMAKPPVVADAAVTETNEKEQLQAEAAAPLPEPAPIVHTKAAAVPAVVVAPAPAPPTKSAPIVSADDLD